MISPVIGFGLTMALVLLIKWISKKFKYKKLFEEPKKKKSPPFLIRMVLILTCTSVSYSHGSNDGQKGVGLIMIILIALVPMNFAINQTLFPEKLLGTVNQIENVVGNIDQTKLSEVEKATITEAHIKIDSMQAVLTGVKSFKDLKSGQSLALREDILLSAKLLKNITDPKEDYIKIKIDPSQKTLLSESVSEMKTYTEYAPWWVILIISLSLGFGTMIGWKRIVVTIGEKIGKEHLSYAQGGAAELVTATTIMVSTQLKLPVSTTHILSSGVAGSMVATSGLKNLRKKTVKNILIAWLITVPVTILLSGGLFLLFSLLIK
jgi:PiT family inorganic phosphate transporter